MAASPGAAIAVFRIDPVGSVQSIKGNMNVKITWLGHSAFRIESGKSIILIDLSLIHL